MLPFSNLALFALAAFGLVLTPGPNMIYLISRSVTQGRKAGIISLIGVICGFLFHIILVAVGLTAILVAIPFAFATLKVLGVLYLLYLAYRTIKPNAKNLFERSGDLKDDTPGKLFTMGLFTNVLNPKMAVFYLSFFPQFIKLEQGSVLVQCFQLGIIQMIISFTVNAVIIVSAAKAARWFSENRRWVSVQKWFVASMLAGLAVKMALAKSK